MVVATRELLQPVVEHQQKVDTFPIHIDRLPWYIAPDSKVLPHPKDIPDEVDLSLLGDDIFQFAEFSDEVNRQRKETGEESIEVGMTYSMSPFTRRIEVRESLIGIHDDIESNLNSLPARGFAPTWTIHRHIVTPDKILQKMHSHRDHLPEVMERSWGRLCKTNMVFSQEDGEPPTIYLSLPTTETRSMSREQREEYDIKWNEIAATAGLAEKKQLEVALEDTFDGLYQAWKHQMDNGMVLLAQYRERKAAGVLTSEEHVVWQSEAARFRELNEKAALFHTYPDVVVAQQRLQNHIARTDHAVRMAAAKDIGVTVLVATGWDMKFKKLDLAA
jgi:hypothetical protein